MKYKIVIPKEEPKTKCYCGHTTYCDCGVDVDFEIKQETLEEAADKTLQDEINYWYEKTGSLTSEDVVRRAYSLGITTGAKWQQEQEQNNENSWFNEYQEVENYIIKRIGDKFLEATPEKYNTASEATIALLENNWQQEQNKKLYSEEDVHKILGSYSANKEVFSHKYTYNKWFEQFKKK